MYIHLSQAIMVDIRVPKRDRIGPTRGIHSALCIVRPFCSVWFGSRSPDTWNATHVTRCFWDRSFISADNGRLYKI